ncbi:MAG: hypothetical protein ACFFE5_12620 [Candidatus Thorarchaeota archaeon]
MERKKYLQVGLLFTVLTVLCLLIFIIISVVADSGSQLFTSAIEIISIVLIIFSIISGVLACLLIALFFIKKL